MKHDYNGREVKTGGKSGLTNLCSTRYIVYVKFNTPCEQYNYADFDFFRITLYRVLYIFIFYQCSTESAGLRNVPDVRFDWIPKASRSHWSQFAKQSETHIEKSDCSGFMGEYVPWESKLRDKLTQIGKLLYMFIGLVNIRGYNAIEMVPWNKIKEVRLQRARSDGLKLCHAIIIYV